MKHLVVNSDDFGMCHSVNRGILRGFHEGILTQSTLMAPAPWFDEAAALAREHGLPVGVHLTASCDWDRYAWRPLTHASSLVGPDGTFLRDLRETAACADREEWIREFVTQVERVRAAGIEPTHLDSHMTPMPPELVAETCRRTGLRSRCDLGEAYRDVMFPLASRLSFSREPLAERKRLFRSWIEGLGDGWHFFCAHLAEPSDELHALCSPGWHAREWAVDIRQMDLALLLDPEWEPLCRALDIELTSFQEGPA
jgi:chitin disaccharide deacetylase